MSYFKAKCTKFDFEWGSAPDPAGGAHSAPTDPLAGFNGSYFYGKGMEGKGKEGWEGKKGSGEGASGFGGTP